MQGWKEIKLKHVTNKIGSGATPTGGSNSYSMSGIAFVRSQNVLSLNFSENGLAYIDDEQATLLNNVAVENEDVFLNITGDSVARVCRVPKHILPARVNQHVSIIRSKPGSMESNFILYYLHSIKDYLLSLSEIGGTRRALTKAMLEDLPILLPPLPEQKAIASVLSSLDDKIDLLHRQNKTLEAMAETLFRQWFVEEADETWEERPLSSFGKIVCGKTPQKMNDNYFGGEIPFIKIPDMHGKVFVLQSNDSLSYAGSHSQINKMIPPLSICVSCIATVGLVSMNFYESQTNQQINTIIPNDDIHRYYLFLYLRSAHDLLQSMGAGGTATLNINTTDFSKILIPMPSESIIKGFHEIVNSLFEKIKGNQFHIYTLEKLRDTLLPKLMSGEVRVKV